VAESIFRWPRTPGRFTLRNRLCGGHALATASLKRQAAALAIAKPTDPRQKLGPGITPEARLLRSAVYVRPLCVPKT
jgi:hypothetical protein